jgi:integrase
MVCAGRGVSYVCLRNRCLDTGVLRVVTHASESVSPLVEDLVFTGTRGAVLRGGNYRNRYFSKAVERCQKADETFPDITPHDLRHTAASLAVSAGANVKALQRMLGHAKASMTLDVYADLFDDDLDVVADQLDAIIKTITTVTTGKPNSAEVTAD